MKVIQPEVVFISNNDYAEMLDKIEKIGRVCYKSEDNIKEGSAEKFIRGIVAHGHESVIEHESITVKVICDRGVTHEIVRHRIASYSQESTRYCNYTNDKFGNQITCIDIASGFHYNLDDPADRKKYERKTSFQNDSGMAGVLPCRYVYRIHGAERSRTYLRRRAGVHHRIHGL